LCSGSPAPYGYTELRMTITFENDNDIIVYALEKVISHARRTQHIFVVQWVWWLASVIGLESGLINHIDNLHRRTMVKESRPYRNRSPVQEDRTPGSAKLEEDKCDKILKECEQYLQESGRLRCIATRQSKWSTRTDQNDHKRISKKILNKATQGERRNTKIVVNKEQKISKTAGIDEAEVQRRQEK
jgi:hypothetical protein